jgi:hypothetical protein
MNAEPRTLAGALATARAALNEHEPPPALRAAVLAVWPAPAPAVPPAVPRAAADRVPPRRARWAALSAWSGALACGVVLASSAWLMLHPRPPLPGAAGGTGIDSAFVPIAPPERWPAGDAAPAWIVNAELPAERLAALGLPFDPTRAGEPVRAELLLHPSGEVLALRLAR